MRPRPTGISILAVVEFLLGILALYEGLALTTEISALAAMGFTNAGTINAVEGLEAVLGVVSLVLGYGLWTGKEWAWLLAVVFSVVSIILAAVVYAILPISPAGSVLSVVIALIVLFYLYRPQVKEFFGRSRTPAAPGPTPPS